MITSYNNTIISLSTETQKLEEKMSDLSIASKVHNHDTVYTCFVHVQCIVNYCSASLTQKMH